MADDSSLCAREDFEEAIKQGAGQDVKAELDQLEAAAITSPVSLFHSLPRRRDHLEVSICARTPAAKVAIKLSSACRYSSPSSTTHPIEIRSFESRDFLFVFYSSCFDFLRIIGLHSSRRR